MLADQLAEARSNSYHLKAFLHKWYFDSWWWGASLVDCNRAEFSAAAKLRGDGQETGWTPAGSQKSPQTVHDCDASIFDECEEEEEKNENVAHKEVQVAAGFQAVLEMAYNVAKEKEKTKKNEATRDRAA